MKSKKEPAKSGLRQHRHKFVFKFLGQMNSVNYTNLQEVLKKQYQKYYAKKTEPTSPSESNYFSVSTQRFFTNQRQRSVYCSPLETCRDFSSAMSKPIPSSEDLISATPADLSLSDLPSPRVHAATSGEGENPKNEDRRTKNEVFKCPAVMAYVNKKLKKMQPIIEHINKSPKDTKLLSVKEKLAKWQDDLARKKRFAWSTERATRGPNQPIVVTHLSPSRRVNRQPYDVF